MCFHFCTSSLASFSAFFAAFSIYLASISTSLRSKGLSASTRMSVIRKRFLPRLGLAVGIPLAACECRYGSPCHPSGFRLCELLLRVTSKQLTVCYLKVRADILSERADSQNSVIREEQVFGTGWVTVFINENIITSSENSPGYT